MAKKVLITGAAGYVAGRMLPELGERYDLVLLDASGTRSRERPHAQGEPVEGVHIIDLSDTDSCAYGDSDAHTYACAANANTLAYVYPYTCAYPNSNTNWGLAAANDQ